MRRGGQRLTRCVRSCSDTDTASHTASPIVFPPQKHHTPVMGRAADLKPLTKSPGMGPSTPAFADRRIPLGLRDEYVRVGDHIAYFWETPREFGEAIRFLEVGLEQDEFCVIFGHTEANRRVSELLAERGYDCTRLEAEDRKSVV